ncbi:hypothetical protein CROQUDRAFT_15724, partial [Cronartium quercuum f. sp. fusiforme G11]
NKPKIHQLQHLVDMIQQLGPAPLFGTKKFKSYNTVLCEASVHSNHQSPSHDIATTFMTANLLCMLLSG